MTLHVNKVGLRVLGIAESFRRNLPRSRLSGVVMRGDLRIDGVATTNITVGGDDATDGILRIFRRLDRLDINALLLNGDVISWFNIVDPLLLWKELGLPVISLSYEESPAGLEGYIREYFPDPDEKLIRYRKLGPRQTMRLRTGYEVYLRATGASADEARALLNRFTMDGRVPEPLRVARLIARSILLGVD